jgi:hypothetical protein
VAAPSQLQTFRLPALRSQVLQINQTSFAQSATLTNNGNATMVIGGIQITGDYAQTNNCPSSLGSGSSCHSR